MKYYLIVNKSKDYKVFNNKERLFDAIIKYKINKPVDNHYVGLLIKRIEKRDYSNIGLNELKLIQNYLGVTFITKEDYELHISKI